MMPNAKSETLLPIILQKVRPDSIVYTNSFRSYNALDHLFLKECEWRFSQSDPKSQLVQLKQWVKLKIN